MVWGGFTTRVGIGVRLRQGYGGQPSRGLRAVAHASRQVSEGWCGRGDSNPHGLATASPSSWCVCQFRHFRRQVNRGTDVPREVIAVYRVTAASNSSAMTAGSLAGEVAPPLRLPPTLARVDPRPLGSTRAQ